MADGSETMDQSVWGAEAAGPPVPGVLLLFSAGEPLHGTLVLPQGGLVLGRGGMAGVTLNDSRMSREHARVEWRAGVWHVTDLASRNGTVVDGQPISGTVTGAHLRFVRMGDTVFWLCPDLRPHQATHVEDSGEGAIAGARLVAAWNQIRRAAGGGIVHITGESGAGKELAARLFHKHGPRPTGPFVAVNCAAIPEGVAERLLFGARKGAFSGAHADAPGYVQSADGGTLFLDEIGELDLGVQAKLLRVVETREVLPLGAVRPVSVDVRICSATHKDLRDLVGDKRFREDLLFRIGRPHVAVPSLRERCEEVAFLADREVRRADARLRPHASLIESCLLRPWPGNVRELLAELRGAADAALAAHDTFVRHAHLAPLAGLPLSRGDGGESAERDSTTPVRTLPDRATIEEALRRCEGRVATAARILGVHRNQLRRWMDKRETEPKE